MNITQQQVEAGQAVYTKRTLAIYDLLVLGLSNRLIWKCPTPQLITHYNQNVSGNHLDVGVGTGYFLDHCRFPSDTPRVALMDLNPDTLEFASRRVARYLPEIYPQNILEPISFDGNGFDSVGINYLLHCLPGSISVKSVIFDHLQALMNPGAVLFGATLLQGGVHRSFVSKGLMQIYNKKGIFSNEEDHFDDLKTALSHRFKEIKIEKLGCAALFSGRK